MGVSASNPVLRSRRCADPVRAAVRANPADDGPAPVVVDAADGAVFGAAARILGRALCWDLVSRARSPVAEVLHEEAVAHGIASGFLVAELARVHGVLDVVDGDGASTHVLATLWHAGG